MTRHIGRPEIEKKLLSELESEGLVLLVGPRGSGKSTLLERLHARLRGTRPVALVQIEPIAASPEILCERFLDVAREVVPAPADRPHSFDHLLGSISAARDGTVLLLDDITETRTLSYFRDVDKPLAALLEVLTRPGAPKSYATSRFPSWLRAELENLSGGSRSRVRILSIPPIGADELDAAGVRNAEVAAHVTGGLPVHIAPLVDRMDSGATLADALAQELRPGGRMEAECRATLSDLLHRARGYGACKSVLAILAREEDLNLTEIARRMNRTPGATRDYLRWLEEVELIQARDKRFTFVDPVLRLWLRLYGKGHPPTWDDIRTETQAITQLAPSAIPSPRGDEPLPAPATTDATEALIEID